MGRACRLFGPALLSAFITPAPRAGLTRIGRGPARHPDVRVCTVPTTLADDPGEPGGIELPVPAATFPGAAGYLNTASLGLPPAVEVAALQGAVRVWAAGTVSPADYDAAVRRGRAAFARVTGVGSDRIAVAGQVSSFVGLLAPWPPPGARSEEHTSELQSRQYLVCR